MAYRIRRAPEGRRDLPRYYAKNSGGMYWTQLREMAHPFTDQTVAGKTIKAEEAASHVVNIIRNRNGKLRDKLSVEPM